MAEKRVESIADGLKEIIDRDGPSCLADEPYKVYVELLASGAADRKTAAAVLYLMTSGIMADIDCSFDTKEVSETIQKGCSLNKGMADRLAVVLTSLYSDAHRNEWKDMDRKGLRQFLKERFTFTWKGFAVWDAGNGTVDCRYEAEIILAPTEEISKDDELDQLLKQNPFMTKEAIHDLFTKRLKEKLDNEFEDYCTCDDYYPPVVEDFGCNLEYDLPEWCKKNGFKYISLEGVGEDDGYEPKFHHGWY